MIHMLRKTAVLLLCLLLLAGIASADSVTRVHYVFKNWSGEYTGSLDSGKIPFGFGLFESSTPMDGEAWHYIGMWANGLPEGEGAIYLNNGSMKIGTFSEGELISGLIYSVSGLSAVPVEQEVTRALETEAMYIGNKKSMRFHLPTCRAVQQMKESNKVEFFSREEAIERHYIPCGDCNP